MLQHIERVRVLKRPLKDYEVKAIRLYLEGQHTMQEVAELCGWKDRSSVYDLLKKEEAKRVMEEIANESVREAISILKQHSKDAARQLIKIAKGEIDDANKQTVYAVLQAINSVLEKSGLTTKNIVLDDRRNEKESISEEDILADIEEIENKENEEYIN